MLTLMSAVGLAGYQVLLNLGERTVDAATASMLVNSGPIFVAVMAVAFLGERTTRPLLVGIGLGLSGALLISAGRGGTLEVSGGALLTVAAALAQSIYFVLQKPMLRRYSSFELTAYTTWLSAVLLLPFDPTAPVRVLSIHAETWLAVLILAIGVSAAGFVLWSAALAELPASRAASALYAVPAAAIIVSWLWLGELPSVLALVGGIIALSGVVIANRSRQTAGPRDGSLSDPSATPS
jgi:drug/metabolite transporter (DMT)-like permease